MPHFHFSCTEPKKQTGISLYFVSLRVLVIPGARERGDWTEGAKGNQAYCVYTRSLLQIHSFKNLPPLLNMSLNAFLLDFDFTSVFIGLTRNSHAFGFKLIRPISIVTLKFDD